MRFCLHSLLVLMAAPGVLAVPKLPPVRQSEQFTVVDARPVFVHSPGPLRSSSGKGFVRLDVDALLLSAERVKETLHWILDLKGDTGGRIRLVLYTATRNRQDLTLISSFSPAGWEYRLDVPDQVDELKLARGLVQALLLEYGNRGQGPKTAELPFWLTEGLTMHLLAVGGPDVVVGSVPLGSMLRIVRERRGLDHLASAREVLRAEPPSGFHRLGYPRSKDLDGAQLKVFQASAHLFVYELIHGKSGAPGVLQFLRELPRYWNWETALLRAFPAEFTRMLDVEKKWSVDALAFVAKNPSQVWSQVACLDRLDEVLSVAAKVTVASNQLPERAWLTLQQVISTWDTADQLAVLRQKLALLEVLRFHSTPEVLPLVEAYQRAITSYIQKRAAAPRTPQTRMQTTLSASLMAQDTIRELEQLDDRRRALRPENVLSANPR